MTQGVGGSQEGEEFGRSSQTVDKALEGIEAAAPWNSGRIPVKFLLSQVGAGVVIGKAGSSISEIQNKSGAKIQLSRNNEFYPETSERILLVQGQIRTIMTALLLILDRLTGQEEGESKVHMSYDNAELKMIMPARLCGAIIGPKGVTVRSFIRDSGAVICVTPIRQDGEKPIERIVTITGVVDSILRAVALIVAKVVAYPNYHSHPAIRKATAHPAGQTVAAAPSSTPMLAAMPPPYATQQLPMHFHMLPPGAMAQPKPGPVMVTMQVPDERVGVVIGKGGDSIKQMQSLMGVRVVISGRDEFEPGTRNRRVEIYGPPESVQLAQMLLHQKLSQGPAATMMHPMQPSL